MEDETNKPILKVGDKIRIKSKEWFDSQDKTVHGSITPPKGQAISFMYDMSTYCGDIFTIKEIIPCSINTVKVDENPYNWGTWMFDIIESVHEYKVGDKVRIKSKEWFDSQYKSNREDIEPPEEYNRPFFDFMEQYCGNICTIKNVYINTIKFNENDEDWESWMFDPAKKSTEEKSKKRPFFRREPQTGDTIKSPYFNGIIIGENDNKDAFLILTTPYFYKQWLYKDSITEIDGYGRYLYHIDTCELNLNARANKFKESLLLEVEIQVGDLIKTENKEEYIIISNPKYGNSYAGLNTRNYKYARIPRTNNIVLIEPGKYKDLIDTNISYLHERAQLLKDKLLKLNNLNISNNTSYNNSNEFDLSKVIYRSRRIK